jgi:hypothetical protein
MKYLLVICHFPIVLVFIINHFIKSTYLIHRFITHSQSLIKKIIIRVNLFVNVIHFFLNQILDLFLFWIHFAGISSLKILLFIMRDLYLVVLFKKFTTLTNLFLR